MPVTTPDHVCRRRLLAALLPSLPGGTAAEGRLREAVVAAVVWGALSSPSSSSLSLSWARVDGDVEPSAVEEVMLSSVPVVVVVVAGAAAVTNGAFAPPAARSRVHTGRGGIATVSSFTREGKAVSRPDGGGGGNDTERRETTTAAPAAPAAEGSADRWEASGSCWWLGDGGDEGALLLLLLRAPPPPS
ncbi:hypothetical protein DFJ73DRAFT_847980 [Zopfochytrium polystomum]|nr:hypothetical protein DFJ73DRAFT_847980 [Zopfochytrium polystomum]